MHEADFWELHPLGQCCFCGAWVRPDGFRDGDSHREYTITGACQRCQDLTFFAISDDDAPRGAALFRGVVAAVRCAGEGLGEVALLPFHFRTWDAQIAWEPRFLVRAGAALAPIDPWDALAPMCERWAHHPIRVTELPGTDAPALREGLARSHLIVTLDVASARALAAGFGVAPEVSVASLADAFAWRDAFGCGLLPFDAFVASHAGALGVGPDASGKRSPLHVCVLLARLLGLTAPLGPAAGETPFGAVLGARRAYFRALTEEMVGAVA